MKFYSKDFNSDQELTVFVNQRKNIRLNFKIEAITTGGYNNRTFTLFYWEDSDLNEKLNYE
jgi:hypothetical protein